MLKSHARSILLSLVHGSSLQATIFPNTDTQIQDQAGSCPQPPLTVVWAQKWTKMDISEAIFSGITYHEI